MDGKKKKRGKCKISPPASPLLTLGHCLLKSVLADMSFEGVFLELLSNFIFYFYST